MFNLSFQLSFLLYCILLTCQSICIDCLPHDQGQDIQVLNVGKELVRQVLPLKMGQGIYNIRGLKESHWYEVKISYPASIPASFSLQVKSNVRDLWLSKNRRLLDAEKLIFKSDDSGHGEMYIVVTVEPAGVVAKPGVREGEFVLFNIVCDELSLGIPHKAWWVGTAAILCLILASIIPHFFQLQWLPNIQDSQSSYSTEIKAS